MMAHPLLIGTVPLPVSVNNYTGITTRQPKKATVYLTKAARQWKKDATLFLYAGNHDVPRIHAVREHPAWLEAELVAVMTEAQLFERDVDNCLKLTLDTVIGEYLAINDVYISDLQIKKRPTLESETPVLHIAVGLLNEGDTDVSNAQPSSIVSVQYDAGHLARLFEAASRPLPDARKAPARSSRRNRIPRAKSTRRRTDASAA